MNSLPAWSFQLCPDSVTLCIVAHQAPLAMGFTRQEYWSGLPCLPPEDLPNPGTEARTPGLQADSLLLSPRGKMNNLNIYIFQSHFWAKDYLEM